MKNLLVTGYRANELAIFDRKHPGIGYIQKALAAKLIPLVEEGVEWVITPGQYGVDLWACETVIELKKQYPHLKLSIVTAFSNPEQNWKEDRQNYYREILQGVDYYGSVSNQPYSGTWQLAARDELLLRKSDGILLVYDEDSGDGSPKYMKEKALRKSANGSYRYIGIGWEDIRSIADADEEERRTFE